jgi:hypothetical protein
MEGIQFQGSIFAMRSARSKGLILVHRLEQFLGEIDRESYLQLTN